MSVACRDRHHPRGAGRGPGERVRENQGVEKREREGREKREKIQDGIAKGKRGKGDTELGGKRKEKERMERDKMEE